jgi:beta-glucosidase
LLLKLCKNSGIFCTKHKLLYKDAGKLEVIIMYRLLVLVVLLLFLSCSENAKDAFINGLIAKMTLEEKIGQLTQLPGGRRDNPNSAITLEEEDLIRAGKVGSFFHVSGAVFLKRIQTVAVEESRLGIPLLFAMDNLHGFRTIFPVPLAWASSWEPESVEKATRIAAEEASASGLHWTFAPMVDIAQDPRWGRIVEGAGEDPYLGSLMAAAQVRGFQGSDLRKENTLLACAKHYVGYGGAIGGRDYNSVDVSLSTVHELYLPPFHAAVNAGVGTIMSGFNDLSGIPMTIHDYFINGVLRYKWGFRGFVVSDWNAIAELINHGVAAKPSTAAKRALEAGIDMDMRSRIYQTELPMLIREGGIIEKLVDRAVRRILSAKYDLGLFDDPYCYCDSAREAEMVLHDHFITQAHELACKSIVLLKNENDILPIRKDVPTLSIIGNLAADTRSPMGAWKGFGQEQDVITVLQGIQRAVAKQTRVLYAEGYAFTKEHKNLHTEALAVARQGDVVILVVGEHSDMSGEARSRSDIGLPGEQAKLARAILAAGKPVIVVLMNGRPLAIEDLAKKADVLLETWFLGIRMGTAVAAVIFGDHTPGGKLPVSFPRSTGQIPVYYNHRNTGRPAADDLTKDTARYFDIGINPLFAFGHGLSYTEFTYDKLNIEVGSDTVYISAYINNTGMRAGDEVVQLYIRALVPGKSRPVKELKGFKRLHLKPGEKKRVQFAMPYDILGYYDFYQIYRVEKGIYNIMLGSASDDIRLEDSFEIKNDVAGINQNKLGHTRVVVYGE